MPKCLDCNNTRSFSFREDSYNEAYYDSEGNLEEVVYKDFDNVRNGICLSCQSTNIEGDL
jgi:hypothetical protein